MEALNEIPLEKLAIIVGVASAAAWLLLPRPLALLVTLVGGGLLAWRSKSGSGTTGTGTTP